MELAPRLTALIASHGLLALSGILAKQADDVASHYQSDFTLTPAVQDEDWIRISGKKRS